MADLALLAGAGLLLLWLLSPRTRRHRTGAGASAAARARQLRTPLVRIADACGISTRRSRTAARWQAGAEGERRTAALLDVLSREGWAVLHDRALPGSRANVDHLLIAPSGAVLLPDSKRWSARHPVHVQQGRLWHGDRDVTGRLAGLQHETATVARLLGVPVRPVVVMHGAAVPATGLTVSGVRIVPASHAVAAVRRLADTGVPHPHPARLTTIAMRALPPYQQGDRRG